MTSHAITIDSKEKQFTISLTKAELDSIQKHFLEEMKEMLDKIRSQSEKK